MKYALVPDVRWTWPAVALLMGADAIMSIWAIENGIAVEANPLPWAKPEWMMVAKLVSFAISSAFIVMMRQWPILARATSMGVCVAMLFVITNNMGVILQ